MDIRSMIVIFVLVVGALILYGIMKKMISVAITAVIIVAAVVMIGKALPQGVKASIDLSLCLTGAKAFKTIPEESLEVLKSGYIKLTPSQHLNYSYPTYKSVKDAPPVTTDNIHDFDMKFFTITKVYQGVEVKYQTEKYQHVKDILTSYGLIQ